MPRQAGHQARDEQASIPRRAAIKAANDTMYMHALGNSVFFFHVQIGLHAPWGRWGPSQLASRARQGAAPTGHVCCLAIARVVTTSREGPSRP